jgi:hypothetical protein
MDNYGDCQKQAWRALPAEPDVLETAGITMSDFQNPAMQYQTVEPLVSRVSFSEDTRKFLDRRGKLLSTEFVGPGNVSDNSLPRPHSSPPYTNYFGNKPKVVNPKFYDQFSRVPSTKRTTTDGNLPTMEMNQQTVNKSNNSQGSGKSSGGKSQQNVSQNCCPGDVDNTHRAGCARLANSRSTNKTTNAQSQKVRHKIGVSRVHQGVGNIQQLGVRKLGDVPRLLPGFLMLQKPS